MDTITKTMNHEIAAMEQTRQLADKVLVTAAPSARARPDDVVVTDSNRARECAAAPRPFPPAMPSRSASQRLVWCARLRLWVTDPNLRSISHDTRSGIEPAG